MSGVLTMILAGGEGTRLAPLTGIRAKPAVPFGGNYRIIDFVLSNLYHSGFNQLLVLTQYQPASLHRHLQQYWQPLFARSGALQLCQAPADANQGTAGAVAHQLSVIRDYRPDVIAVLSADHVYKMDYRQMLAFHLKQQAAVTVSAVAVPLSLARQFGIFSTDEQHHIINFCEKPLSDIPTLAGRPGYALASMGNYLFDAQYLCQQLERLDLSCHHDFGHHLLPTLCEQQLACVYDFSTNQLPGEQSLPHYWRDVGTLSAYFHSKLDIMQHPDWLDGPKQHWPILAAGKQPLRYRIASAAFRRLPLQTHQPLYS